MQCIPVVRVPSGISKQITLKQIMLKSKNPHRPVRIAFTITSGRFLKTNTHLFLDLYVLYFFVEMYVHFTRCFQILKFFTKRHHWSHLVKILPRLDFFVNPMMEFQDENVE